MGINVLSCFDGISCGQIALERAGIAVDNYYASEIDKYAIKVTTANYPKTIQLGSVTEWRQWELPKIDLLIAGFPCQSYSIAGNRLGLEDFRGQLIYSMIEVIRHFQPEDIMLENVKGFLSVNNGAIFRFLLQELNSCGYAVDWMVINSSLVSAQHRERIYIIGKRLDKCKGLVYNYDIGDRNDKRKRNDKRDDGVIR